MRISLRDRGSGPSLKTDIRDPTPRVTLGDLMRGNTVLTPKKSLMEL